jgi:hypothetical protein
MEPPPPPFPPAPDPPLSDWTESWELENESERRLAAAAEAVRSAAEPAERRPPLSLSAPARPL